MLDAAEEGVEFVGLHAGFYAVERVGEGCGDEGGGHCGDFGAVVLQEALLVAV